MTDEKNINSVRVNAIETAKDIVSGKIGAIAGSRAMTKLLWQAEISESDPDLLSFVAIDSETDDLPVGNEMSHWLPEALQEKDVEIKRCEALYRQAALDACENIIRRWKDLV